MAFKAVLAGLVLSVAAASAHAEDTIKIGGLLETSGAVASLGRPGLEGAMLAVDQINAKGGIGSKKVELVNVNTESDNTKSVTAAKRLVDQSDIVALVGPMNSGSSYAIIDTVQRAGVPMISNAGRAGLCFRPQTKSGYSCRL